MGGYNINKYFLFSLILVLFLSVSCIYAEDNSTLLEDVNIDSNDVSMYYRNGTRLNVALSDSNDNPVSDAVLQVNVNGQSYARMTNEMGRTSLAINLNPGKYLANIHFLGNDKFSSSNKTVNIEVLPTIYGNDLVKYYKNASQYYATFRDGTGEVLDYANVTFNINGVFYTRQTDQNGVARLNINLRAGDYILTAYNPNDGFSHSNNIKVIPTINSSDLEKIYRDNHQYWVTLRDGNGNLIKNGEVEFNVNGVFYTRKSNYYGNAKLNINLGAGKYVITAINLINGEEISNTILVHADSDTRLTTSNYVFRPNDDDGIRATLTNKLNYGVNDEIIELSIGNKTYSESTNKNGVATFYLDLVQGNYSLKFNHKATSVYGASSASSTMETYDGIKAHVVGEDDIIFRNGEYSVTLYDENNTLFVNKTVYFRLDSTIFSSITDEAGVATVNVDVAQDEYDVMYFFNETGYKFTKGFSSLVVLEDGQTRLSPATKSVTEGIGEKLNVLLSVGSIPLSSKKVNIEINGVNYTRTTDDGGMAGLTINLAPGTYRVNYYFEGEGLFLSSHASSSLIVNPRISTYLAIMTGNTYYKNFGFTYNIQLKGDKLLSNRLLNVKIGSESFSQMTDNDGIIHLDIKSFNDGVYDVSCSFDGDTDYASVRLDSKVLVSSEIPYGYGYWVRYRDMYALDLASLSSQGTNHLFVHSYVFDAYGENNVVAWLKQANDYGIKVHIWMQAFYDGGWINPVNSDGSYKYGLFNSIIDEAKHYAGLKGVNGIHFDYLRYPGTAYAYSTGTAAINYFVSQASSAIRAVNPNCILSAAVMPEPSSMTYYYGQDIPTISRYLDAILPMVYKGNYEAGTSWIRSTTKWFVDNSNGAQIWTGLQAYASDDDVTKLPVSELASDAQTALNAGAKGVVMFRWGVTNFINFNTLKTS